MILDCFLSPSVLIYKVWEIWNPVAFVLPFFVSGVH